MSEQIVENNPATYSKVGEIISVDTNPNFDSAVAVEVDFVESEEPQTILIPYNYYVKAKMDRWMTEGNFIQVNFEITKANSTTYKDSNGALQYHTKDNDAKVGRVRKASKRMVSQALADDIANTGKYQDLTEAQGNIVGSILSK